MRLGRDWDMPTFLSKKFMLGRYNTMSNNNEDQHRTHPFTVFLESLNDFIFGKLG